MQSVVDELAGELESRVESLAPSQRYVVALCGIPGSGKSSFAQRVVSKMNALWEQKRLAHHAANSAPADGAGGIAVVVGMDGWHLTRKQLSAFPDPQLAHDRRGAPWTFDGQAFSDFVAKLANTGGQEVWAPGFSHAVKDPVEVGVRVAPYSKVVLVEGLYCVADEPPWLEGAQAVNERWLLEVSRDVARERLVQRHVATGVAPDAATALWRAENNDLPNGDWVLSHALAPYRRIESRAEPSWAEMA